MYYYARGLYTDGFVVQD